MTDFFTVGPNQIVRGLINPDFSYSIHDFDADILYSGKASSLRAAKAKVRELLILCGVKFNGEIRK
jgi:hypothetical protein